MGVIAWRLFDIQGISSAYCTHQILMEDEYKPVVQSQRRLNPNMQEVVKKEVLKLMDAGMIYPISDSPGESPTQVVPKKGGITVVMNEKNELIPSRTVTDWRVSSFIVFLMVFGDIFKSPLHRQTKRRRLLHVPVARLRTVACRLDYVNASAMFHRCMVAIFQDMMETSMEVFMDDFLVYVILSNTV
ncbi:uncharacterized protein LOC143572845 [Bidens hawaiensis]|uniref:uncharacterized protein LOC143572845 n=1 Tax=Bidens hawaiensis TaxID=980011 RepID=UPI00404A826C